MTIHDATSILAISGSLRRASLNSRLIAEAQKLAPDTVQFDTYNGLGELPHFNEDHEFPAPRSVQEFRRRVTEAGGLLIATPEYSASIPGVLKNALDWLSRPGSGATLPLTGKPVAIIGASQGPLGTIRAQLTLRQILHKVDAAVVGQPEFILPNAHLVLAEELPVDSATAGILRLVLNGLQTMIDAP